LGTKCQNKKAITFAKRTRVAIDHEADAKTTCNHKREKKFINDFITILYWGF
jgi:hypothetical protein